MDQPNAKLPAKDQRSGRGSVTPGDFAVETLDGVDGVHRLRFSGGLRFQACYHSWRELHESTGRSGAQRVVFDLSEVEALDGGSAALLIDLANELEQAGKSTAMEGARDEVQRLLDLYGAHAHRPSAKAPPVRLGAFDQLGTALVGLWRQLLIAANFIGTFVVEVRRATLSPSAIPWRTVVRLWERHGADAVIIVAVINLLVGVILAFQSAGQLERFGAEVFVADLVGLSVVRELGPLMTAILVAGRSGAAYAAELGTMKVSEEVDALRTLGLSPTAFLVLPRVLALLLALPMLTLIANACGLLGGLLIGVGILDLTLIGYWRQTLDAIGGLDIATGMLKSLVFAVTIAMVACERGLATRGGAEGVGRSTTSAVVSCIFQLVVLDAALTWLFSLYDL